MNARSLIIGAACVVGLAAVMLMSRHEQAILTDHLPPRIAHSTQAEAEAIAGPNALPVLGTGSEAPYIPAAPAGKDPYQTITAYVVLRPGATFDDITPGVLVLRQSNWATARGSLVMHSALAKHGDTWIASGLHNAVSDTSEPITRANFVGIVASVHVFPITP